ncbi:MAG: thiol protease/hemagglutinin PrtT [Muribaculaceae bacterium]|nr:thiol protease/hemagglutinin PrtT [Muribaculaceae bacterium]
MRLLITLSLIFGIFSAFARQIPVDEAKEVAQNFLSSKSEMLTRGMNDATVKDLKFIDNKSFSSVHIFNVGETDGFILVSAVGEKPKILGYSDKGSFDLKNLPPQLNGILGNTTYFKEGYPRFSTRATANGILHQTAEWGQGAPFNNLAPNNAATGCVATAMAITMQYHQWPEYTRGGELFDWYFPDFKLNFDDYKINWHVLSDKNDPQFDDEVSLLMKSAGIASHMLYGMNEFNESGAEVWAIGNRMIELYAYDKDCQYIEKESFDDSQWNQMLRQQLDEVGPVIYRGGSVTAHCFVIDGYDNEGFYHVNWGWDGQSNGYYALDFSDVGGMNFGEYQGMIINIKPDKERKEYSKAFFPNANVYNIGGYTSSIWNFSTPDIDTGENVYLIAPVVTLNGQQGFFRLAVVDENDKIIKLIGDEPELGVNYINAVDDAPYCAHPGMDLYFNVVFPPLKEGQRYQLVSQDAKLVDKEWGILSPEYPSNDPTDYKIVLGGMLNPSYFYAKNNTSIYSYANFHIDENLPYMGQQNCIFDHEFTFERLRYDDITENFFVPSSGVSMEVYAKDENGNDKTPLYVAIYDQENYEKFLFDFTISAYEPYYEVYFKYNPADPKRTEGIDVDKLIEKDGLIFKIDGENCSLIGYDLELIQPVISVPSMVSKDGNDYKVVEIAREALLLAPIKSLTIDAKNLTNIGRMGLAGMRNIEDLRITNLNDNIIEEWFVSPLLQSSLSNLYSNKFFSYNELCALSGAYYINMDRANIERSDMNFYFSSLPDDPNLQVTFDSFRKIKEGIKLLDNSYSSLNLPGVGNTYVPLLESFELPFTQMWEYEIDKDKYLLAISNIIDIVKIESVAVNGQTISINQDGYYPIPSEALMAMEVTINYTVNGNQNMQTIYSPDYNNSIKSVTLGAGVDTIIDYDNENVSVYNTQGMKVLDKASKDDLNSLNPGIYIIGNKKVVIK